MKKNAARKNTTGKLNVRVYPCLGVKAFFYMMKHLVTILEIKREKCKFLSQISIL